MSVTKVVPGSFRDPNGFVFSRDDVLYRQINDSHRTHYDRFMESGLYRELIEDGLLIPHLEVTEAALRPELAYKVILPERVNFISYPYEWSFSQLKDAALVTLTAQKKALERGMSLRDASAFNIQFHRGRPVLIDTLSFEDLDEGRPWVAYGQFCRHFLAPLALMSYGDVRLGQLMRSFIDGLPLDLATGMLPIRARLRFSLLLHLFLHARSQRRHQDSGAMEMRSGSGKFDLRSFNGLIESLTVAVEKLRPPRSESAWSDYYENSSHYGEVALENKKAIVAGFIKGVSPSTVWDLGANTGAFSRIAADLGIETVALEMDPGCVERNYERVKAEATPNLLPLLCDLTNPSSGTGWENKERMSLAERGPADMVLALALIHHLAIGNNVPLKRIAHCFAGLGRHLIVEFIPKEDEKVRQLLASREDIFPGYTRSGFEAAFADRFVIERVKEIEDTERVLYLMRAA